MATISKKDLIFYAKLEKARRSFWYYCQLKASDFYTNDKLYLKKLCDELQEFYFNDEQVLMLNLPPRHAKSRTATLFVQWVLGQNNKLTVMTASYNQTLSTTFATQVRNAIMERKVDEYNIVYNDIFPKTIMSDDSRAKDMWKLKGSDLTNYLATSPSGTATGFGADFIVVDDLIKNEYEARNQNTLEKQYEWFTNTILSRSQGKRKIILIMTRWSDYDLCGRLQEHYNTIGLPYKLVTYKALNENNVMLCDDILNYHQYKILEQTLGADIMSANYNQEPINIKGALFNEFMTYDTLPIHEILRYESYTDTADTGDDSLTSIIYGITKNKKAYIVDVIHTKESMEHTYKKLVDSWIKYNVTYAHIERNSGGTGYVTLLNNEMRDRKHISTVIKDFHQSANKIARILSNAVGVINTVVFHSNWKITYRDFAKELLSYQREGKNKHDDAPDCLTGVYEKVAKNVTGWQF